MNAVIETDELLDHAEQTAEFWNALEVAGMSPSDMGMARVEEELADGPHAICWDHGQEKWCVYPADDEEEQSDVLSYARKAGGAKQKNPRVQKKNGLHRDRAGREYLWRDGKRVPKGGQQPARPSMKKDSVSKSTQKVEAAKRPTVEKTDDKHVIDEFDEIGDEHRNANIENAKPKQPSLHEKIESVSDAVGDAAESVADFLNTPVSEIPGKLRDMFGKAPSTSAEVIKAAEEAKPNNVVLPEAAQAKVAEIVDKHKKTLMQKLGGLTAKAIDRSMLVVGGLGLIGAGTATSASGLVAMGSNPGLFVAGMLGMLNPVFRAGERLADEGMDAVHEGWHGPDKYAREVELPMSVLRQLAIDYYSGILADLQAEWQPEWTEEMEGKAKYHRTGEPFKYAAPKYESIIKKDKLGRRYKLDHGKRVPIGDKEQKPEQSRAKGAADKKAAGKAKSYAESIKPKAPKASPKAAEGETAKTPVAKKETPPAASPTKPAQAEPSKDQPAKSELTPHEAIAAAKHMLDHVHKEIASLQQGEQKPAPTSQELKDLIDSDPEEISEKLYDIFQAVPNDPKEVLKNYEVKKLPRGTNPIAKLTKEMDTKDVPDISLPKDAYDKIQGAVTARHGELRAKLLGVSATAAMTAIKVIGAIGGFTGNVLLGAIGELVFQSADASDGGNVSTRKIPQKVAEAPKEPEKKAPKRMYVEGGMTKYERETEDGYKGELPMSVLKKLAVDFYSNIIADVQKDWKPEWSEPVEGGNVEGEPEPKKDAE